MIFQLFPSIKIYYSSILCIKNYIMFKQSKSTYLYGCMLKKSDHKLILSLSRIIFKFNTYINSFEPKIN